MTRYKVSNEDLKRLAELYNSDGKRAVYKTIRNDYHVKNPTDIFKRMASRPAAMDKLIRELIGDRLLELNKYVKIDSLSKRIIIDQSTLNQDGYRLVTR